VPGAGQQLEEALGSGAVPGTARGSVRVGGGDGDDRREGDNGARKQSWGGGGGDGGASKNFSSLTASLRNPPVSRF
jgi:hypothetical protein